MMASKYELIAKKMGTPWSNEMEKILKTLFTTEEADIILVFNGPYLDRFSANKIANRIILL
jgi:hypothetical protein